MASSLSSLFPDEDVIPPYESVSNFLDADVPSVVSTGGLISNFNNIIFDETVLDVQSAKVKTFPLSTPLPIPRNGGTTNLRLDVPIDSLINPSSINIQIVFSLMKRGTDGASTAVELSDGIIPVCGYYPLQNVVISLDNSEINAPDIQNLDLSLLRNIRLMEMLTDCSKDDMERIHRSYSGWHLNCQTLADSKTGNYGGYTHTADTHVITKVNDAKTGGTVVDNSFNLMRENINTMLAGEFISTVEIPYTFLTKTRLLPFIVKNINFELKWASPGNIFSQELPVPTAKEGVYDTLHFVLKNAYISYQTVLANPSLINSFSTISAKGKTNDFATNMPMAYPSWVTKNILKYDTKTVPTGQSSALLNLKGRYVPEVLFIIFRRKAMVNTKTGNFRYFDFPNVTNIIFSSDTYNHLKYLEGDRSGISMFHKSLEGISCYADYNTKSIKAKRRIDKQLDFLTIYSSRAIRNIPLEGSNDAITKPEIFLNGHSYFTKSYRRAVMSGCGVRSKPILADLKVEIAFAKSTTEEMLVDIYGCSDAIVIVNPDRSFRVSQDESGSSVKDSIAVHEAMSRAREDLNMKVNEV